MAMLQQPAEPSVELLVSRSPPHRAHPKKQLRQVHAGRVAKPPAPAASTSSSSQLDGSDRSSHGGCRGQQAWRRRPQLGAPQRGCSTGGSAVTAALAAELSCHDGAVLGLGPGDERVMSERDWLALDAALAVTAHSNAAMLEAIIAEELGTARCLAAAAAAPSGCGSCCASGAVCCADGGTAEEEDEGDACSACSPLAGGGGTARAAQQQQELELLRRERLAQQLHNSRSRLLLLHRQVGQVRELLAWLRAEAAAAHQQQAA